MNKNLLCSAQKLVIIILKTQMTYCSVIYLNSAFEFYV